MPWGGWSIGRSASRHRFDPISSASTSSPSKNLLTSIAVLLIDQQWHCWSQMIACCVLNNSKTFFMEQNATFSIRDKCFVFYWIEPTWINSFASFYLFWGIVVASNGGSALELATLTVPWSRKSSGSTLVHFFLRIIFIRIQMNGTVT